MSRWGPKPAHFVFTAFEFTCSKCSWSLSKPSWLNHRLFLGQRDKQTRPAVPQYKSLRLKNLLRLKQMIVSPSNTLKKKEKKRAIGISMTDMTNLSKKFRRPQLDRAVEILFENIGFEILSDTPKISIGYLIPPSLYPKSDKVPPSACLKSKSL